MDKHWKDDLMSGFIVFLIALPLSIGIALAAGVPASAGILSAILGGIIGTLISGSHIAINGPAAGLIVVISSSVVSLGGGDLALGFKRTLAATVVVGVLQILLGLFRLGSLAFLCPTSVVHGMLAAIGTIIMVKQTPVLLGVTPVAKSIPGIVAEIPQMIMNNDLPIFITGLVCVLILLLWKKIPQKFTQFIPGPLVVVIVGLIFSYILDVEHPHNINWLDHGYHLGPEFLVHVPNSLKEMFIFPTFDIIITTKSLISIMTIFIVGSLESLLSAFAVDQLDPQKRKSNLNLDIIGKGVTNIFCGFLGAYPIITEIVRSSANISNGAKTKWTNLYHGLFILIFVALLPDLINHIPLSALAAVLILVGFNLAHPKQFVEIYHHGKDQLFIFCLTMIVTLLEDLLIGIGVGILAKLIIHFIRGVRPRHIFKLSALIEKDNGMNILLLNDSLIFLNFLQLKKKLDDITSSDNYEIRVKKGIFIDFTIMELLKEYKVIYLK